MKLISQQKGIFSVTLDDNKVIYFPYNEEIDVKDSDFKNKNIQKLIEERVLFLTERTKKSTDVKVDKIEEKPVVVFDPNSNSVEEKVQKSRIEKHTGVN